LDEDTKKTDKHRALRYAKKHNVSFSLSNSGVWEDLSFGRVWRLSLETKGAFFTQVLFKKFIIPPRATVHLYSEKAMLGAFTSVNNKEDMTFVTGPLSGDSFTLEYFEPKDALNVGQMELEEVSHSYRDLFKDDSELCQINTQCPQASDKRNQVNSVVALLSRGDLFCTGTMINNNRKDNRALLLTANHCGVAATNWIVLFAYESITCARGGRVDLTKTVAGVRSLSRIASTDFQLGEVLEKVPRNYGGYLAGFNANDVIYPNAYSIHHPEGAPKKITITTRPLEHSNWRMNNGPLTHLLVREWQHGVTEPGSSGGAIFNSRNQVIGQLEGGESTCRRMAGNDLYGKLSWSWELGTPRLRTFLDPVNTGVKELDGMELREETKLFTECELYSQFCSIKSIKQEFQRYCISKKC